MRFVLSNYASVTRARHTISAGHPALSFRSQKRKYSVQHHSQNPDKHFSKKELERIGSIKATQKISD
jgi:hypothetical protein